MDNLITITAATNQRHFSLNNANAKLILRYLKLVGGVGGLGGHGGSIWIIDGELNLYSSIVFNNKAKYGGGIAASGTGSWNKNAIMNIHNSIIQNNEATGTAWGGGIYMEYAVGTIYNTKIDNNQAGRDGGGMYIWRSSDVKMKNTNISNNDATDGGGLGIAGYSTTVTLRQSSFINNDATRNGDEISTEFSPTISLINTYFNDPNNNNNIYDYGTTIWKTCSDNLCTESPFTGVCSQVDNKNIKLGVICPMQDINITKRLEKLEQANDRLEKLEKLLGGCTCSASVLTNCNVGDNAAIIAAYKQLNGCKII
jgi:parallel beta-helix repeat protein